MIFIGDIITIPIDNDGCVMVHRRAGHETQKRKYVVDTIHRHYIEVKDLLTGSYNSFNRGDLVMAGVIGVEDRI